MYTDKHMWLFTNIKNFMYTSWQSTWATFTLLNTIMYHWHNMLFNLPLSPDRPIYSWKRVLEWIRILATWNKNIGRNIVPNLEPSESAIVWFYTNQMRSDPSTNLNNLYLEATIRQDMYPDHNSKLQLRGFALKVKYAVKFTPINFCQNYGWKRVFWSGSEYEQREILTLPDIYLNPEPSESQLFDFLILHGLRSMPTSIIA